MSNIYRCNGYRAVRAEDSSEAAVVFANRMAREQFGRGGYARSVRCDSWAADGSGASYQAFIGYTPRGQNCTSGQNVSFYVSRD